MKYYEKFKEALREAHMKQIDLEPGEFEVIELGPPMPIEDQYRPRHGFQPWGSSIVDDMNKSFENLGKSFRILGEVFRSSGVIIFEVEPEPEPEPPRPRHHMQFIEQHIRKARKPRK